MGQTQFLVILIVLFSIHGLNSTAQARAMNSTCFTVACEQKEIRTNHAKELLGKYYSGSIAKIGAKEKVKNVDAEIYQWTKDHLPKKYQKDSKRIARAIISESTKHGFDPVLILSVIQGESSFVPNMRGKAGEVGLMQILPPTGKWMAKRAHVKWKGEKTLLDPVQNIKIGAAFLDYLREHFDMHAQLYLAAYNMGQGNVKRAQSKDIWPKDYPQHVMKKYVEFYTQLKGKSVSRDIASRKT